MEDSSGKFKLCPYCMGELQNDAIKCKHCGEWLEDRDRKDDLKREGEREVRRQIQNKFKSHKLQTSQKSIAKSKGSKGWWASQSKGVKALIIVCIGVVALTGIYLAFGNSQAPDQIPVQSNSAEQNTPIASAKTCTVCGGDGKVSCTNCGGDGSTERKEDCDCSGGLVPPYNEPCEKCGGSGYTTTTVTCDLCKGTGQIKCKNCGGDGKIGN